jgi:glyoxylase-like metal-dependent hydrolase (beta-lactamase superfamily II)
VIRVETIAGGAWKTNSYVVCDAKRNGVLIDPGEEIDAIVGYVKAESLVIQGIFATHAHYDHVTSVADMKERFSAPFYLHRADFRLLAQANFYKKIFGGKRNITIPSVEFDLADCTALQFGDMTFEVIHTPGHTPGSVSLVAHGNIFSGDTILGKRIGRTDLPGGNKDALNATIKRIFTLPSTTLLFPGHGAAVSLSEIIAINREVAELVG